MSIRATTFALFATIATLLACAIAATADPVPLPWSITAGKPTINIGKECAFFVWHVGQEVHVAVTNTNPKGDLFTGTITVDNGVIADPQGVALEKGDSITQVNSHKLTFAFHTYTGLDELEFNMDRAVSEVNIQLEKDGVYASTIIAGIDNIEVATAAGPDGYVHYIVRPDDEPPYDWSLARGAPSIEAGTENAYYVWHDTEYVYIVCTGDAKVLQNFDGEIRLHTANITDITAMNDDSTYDLLEPNVLRWYFKTASGETGVRFKIGSAAEFIGMTFHLDGVYTPHVYFGANKLQLERDADDTVVFNLDK